MSDETRRKWCGALAKLCNPDHPEESTSSLVAMLPMLADLPDAVFASKSALDAVARAHRYTRTPSYADIRSAVSLWIKDTQPMRTALPSPIMPDRVEPTTAEKEAVRAMVAGLTAEVREREQHAAQQLRAERGAGREPKVLSRETLRVMYAQAGLTPPGEQIGGAG